MLSIFFGVGFGWRAWLQQRRFGSSGIMLFRSGRWLQHVREAGLLLLALVSFGQAVAALWEPATIDALRLVFPSAALAWLGTALMIAGTVLMVVAQLDMGASWRVGFDDTTRPGLVVGGLYRICRNPIYVALLVVLTGYTALLPTWLSVGMLAGTAVTVGNQAREEEAYLLRLYGDAYAAYARRVGRFLPGVGRLAAD
jgi:protein-S-isoprenylcysteine O-methyltransferase Ste14